MAGIISREEANQSYARLEKRILELEPDNAYIDYARAFELETAGKLEEAAEMYLKALSKDVTDSEQVRLAAGFARRIGKFETSKRLLAHAVAIDPLCFQCIYQLSNTYLYSGDYDRAIQARERYLGLGSGGHYFYGLMLLLKEQPQAALDTVAEDSDEVGTRSVISAMAYHSLGEPEKASTHFARLVEAHGNDDPLLVAEAAAWMGDADTAFEWLQKARPGEVAIRLFLPVFDSLHDDPQWDALRESVGRSAARLDAIEFDPVMPD
jgi:tetratricopeptide (TPR) repeat protein